MVVRPGSRVGLELRVDLLEVQRLTDHTQRGICRARRLGYRVSDSSGFGIDEEGQLVVRPGGIYLGKLDDVEVRIAIR